MAVGTWAKITTVVAASSVQGIVLSRLSYQRSKESRSGYKDRRGVLEDPAKIRTLSHTFFFLPVKMRRKEVHWGTSLKRKATM